jgi:membrane fusion protein (multidrug efflux system)
MMRRIVYFGLLAAGLAATGCNRKAVGNAPPPAAFAVQVVVAEAMRQPVSETLSLVGTLAANEMVEIKSEIDGTVQEILFQEGQTVKAGDLLLRLDETKFAAAVAEAEANFNLSKANLERLKQLRAQDSISPQEYDQALSQFQAHEASLQLKRRDLKDARLLAPFGGVMAARNVSPGQVIEKKTTLTWLLDLDPVKVEVNVPERFLGQLQVGQNLDLTVAAFPDRKFTGQVFFIAPLVDAATRTALVKARIPNPRLELKPGMFGNLELTLQVRDSAVVIPEMALTQLLENDRALLYTVSPTNTAQLTPVTLGVRLAGQVEVLSGLSGGERVIVEGGQKVGPGAKVQFAPAESAAPSKQPEGGKASR